MIRFLECAELACASIREAGCRTPKKVSDLKKRRGVARALWREIMRGLIVPGLNGSGPDHWQTLWERQYGFIRVEQRDWGNPDAVAWVRNLDAAIRAHPDKPVIIAHSLGCWAVMHWAFLHVDSKERVKSALLVAPPNLTAAAALPHSALSFTKYEKQTLPFFSILVGSENDPYMPLEKARALAAEIGSEFVNAGLAGHINIDSGHGNWPQGEALLQKL
jgi:predicted alpha/beta hydrolase family esterase